DDLIDALVALMNTPDDVIGPINIGNPGEFSMLDLASTIIDLTGSRSRIVHRPLPQDDPRQRRPDISKAHELLSWSPRTPLPNRLLETAAPRARANRRAAAGARDEPAPPSNASPTRASRPRPPPFGIVLQARGLLATPDPPPASARCPMRPRSLSSWWPSWRN